MRLNTVLLVKIGLFAMGLGVILLVLNEASTAALAIAFGAILGGGAILAGKRTRLR